MHTYIHDIQQIADVIPDCRNQVKALKENNV